MQIVYFNSCKNIYKKKNFTLEYNLFMNLMTSTLNKYHIVKKS